MSAIQLIDSHCHLDFEVFDNDRLEVLQRAKDNNISDIVIPGTEKNIALYSAEARVLSSNIFPQLPKARFEVMMVDSFS